MGYGVGALHKISGIMYQDINQNILTKHLVETVKNMPYPIIEVTFLVNTNYYYTELRVNDIERYQSLPGLLIINLFLNIGIG